MTAVSRELRTRVVAAAARAMARAGLLMPASERLFGRFVEEFGLTVEEALVAIGPAACGALFAALQKPGDGSSARVARTLLLIAGGD